MGSPRTQAKYFSISLGAAAAQQPISLQKNLGDWNEVIPSFFISPEVAQVYKKKTDIEPPKKMVKSWIRN